MIDMFQDLQRAAGRSRWHFAGVALLASLSVLATLAEAQEFKPNYDERAIEPISLPDPLRMTSGEKVTSKRAWKSRRSELLSLFAREMYGRSPGRPQGMKFEVIETDVRALDGKATRRQVSILLNGRHEGPRIGLLIYTPNAVKGRVPTVLGLNFRGNHAIHRDPAIRLSDRWIENDAKSAVVENRATEASRGAMAHRWSIDRILASGYGLVTAYYGDIEPDQKDRWREGVRGVFPVDRRSKLDSSTGKVAEIQADEWGAISAWAWGLSRILDYLETDNLVDAKKVVLMGHSRLGKTALWAGAQDPRFAVVISNNSGEGGAALARRNFGETTWRINNSFPHWFCGNFKKYSNRESTLPFDQHELIALMAPRPVYVASAVEDQWADPRGEFLATREATTVYRLFGLPGLGTDEMPGINQPVGRTLGYHIRSGIHEVTDYDWEQYLRFADGHLRAGSKTR